MSNNIPELEFGCEFEFYINANIEEELIEELKSISRVELVINHHSGENIDNKMNYKREVTLIGDTGREITIPICSLADLREYIQKISNIINSNAQTNEDTGFHIHISTVDKILNLDFYRFMLLSDNLSLLNNWGTRNNFSKNVMDILDLFDMEEAKNFKNRKGRVWNLEKISDNHIEIRTMGGTDYQLKVEQILEELNTFIKIFHKALNKPDDEYKKILKEHILKIKECSEERRDKFLEVINI